MFKCLLANWTLYACWYWWYGTLCSKVIHRFKGFYIARGIDPQKLEIGIGIYKMAMVDTNQDPACMAANACLKLMQKNDLNHRILVECMLQLNQH